MELSSAMRRAIRRNESIEVEGLTLYPIRVAEYEEFLTAKPAIEVMQQSFPVQLLSVPLLQALYALDYEAITRGERPCGLFYRCLLFLALSLRLGEGEEPAARVKRFRVVVDPDDPGRLKALRFVLRGEEAAEITPIVFHRLRPILAAQNGIALVSENANPDLVQAERDIAEAKGPKLDGKLDDLIAAVAALSGADEGEIEDWPIRKLRNRQQALDRAFRFLVCGIGETQGTKWKDGNPYPSIFYDRLQTDSTALISMDQFAGGEGLRAMQNQGAAAPPRN